MVEDTVRLCMLHNANREREMGRKGWDRASEICFFSPKSFFTKEYSHKRVWFAECWTERGVTGHVCECISHQDGAAAMKPQGRIQAGRRVTRGTCLPVDRGRRAAS